MRRLALDALNYIVYGLVGVYAAVERCCARRGSTYLTAGWEAVNLENLTSSSSVEYHSLNRVNADIVLHHIRKYHGLYAADRIVVQWATEAGQGYELDSVFDAPLPPWFFIGYIDESGKTVDCTEDMARIVVIGNRITAPLLRYLEPASKNGRWVYVNPKTFDQLEFPAEGILIEGGDAATESTKDD
jgi:hypothetical protein